MVALATLIWLEVPSDFVKISLMPAASRTARTLPPAMTPVPGMAGLSRTVAAPKLTVISWGMVLPLSGTLTRFFLACARPC